MWDTCEHQNHHQIQLFETYVEKREKIVFKDRENYKTKTIRIVKYQLEAVNVLEPS